MGSKSAREKGPRRIYHFRFCESLERHTVNYANTVGNLVKALLTRVYVDSPEWNPPRKTSQMVLHRAAHKLGMYLRKKDVQPLSREGVIDALRRFPEKKRQLYMEGYDTTLDLNRHGRITGFIKQENVPYKPADKPRVIQFRNPVFLAHMLDFYKPLEHAIYTVPKLWNTQQLQSTCAKGMNVVQRMRCLESFVSDLEDAHVVGLDGSAFDAHVVRKALKAEWKFYLEAMRVAGWSEDIIRKARRMGERQEINKCYANVDDGVVKYKVTGNRMSGDLNTGCGNSVLQQWYIATAMTELHVPEKHWRMLVDGDDAVLMVSGKYTHLLPQLPAIFSSFSQDVKMTEVVRVDHDNMEPIEFCQAQPVRVAGEWRLVRNPKKVYNGYASVNIYYRSLEEARRYWATISQPEMIFARGVPVLHHFFEAMHRLSQDSKPLDSVARRWWYRNIMANQDEFPDIGHIEVSTRLSFYKAFGISMSDQAFMETGMAALQEEHLLTRPEDCVFA